MPNNNSTDTKTLNIKRTICIGLGGTGRDILMQIRRLIVDRYGKLSELPVVSFVHIDTDKNASQTTGLKTGDTYHGENILFKPAEIVTATMNKQEIDDLSKGLERRNPHERTSPYYHIGTWFPKQILKDVKSIENGAGAIRPVGRLAFFHNYSKIHQAINTADNATVGHAQRLLSKNIVVDPGTNIIIVGSLCGGTGSGTFIDMAYSLREKYGYEIDSEITAYLIIAPELYGDTPSVKANTYAALKELNYYTAQGTNFDANYDPVNLFSVSENRPPFDFVYLVGNRTNSGHKIVRKEKLSQIVAHKIFADFAEEISVNIKGHRDNVKKYFSVYDEHPRPNAQRYLTFGLAKIYFPRDLTIAICLNKVKIKLINFWLYGEGQSPDSAELLDKFLLNWQSKNETNPNIFKAKLEAITQENDKTFKQLLKNWLSRNQQEIDNCKNGEERQRLIDKIRTEIKSQFKKVQPGETENIRGSWLTQLLKNSIKLEKQFTQDIFNYFANLLEPSNPNFALDNSRGWLEALLTKLNEYVKELEEEKEKNTAFITLENIDKKWQDSCQIFEDIETDKKGLFGIGGKSNKTKNKEFQEEASQSIQDINKLIKRNFDLTLAEEALKIATNLRQLLLELKTKTSNFYNLLQDLEGFYNRKGEDLSHIDEDEINGEAVFEADDNDQYYQTLLPDRERRNLLVEVSHKINESVTLPPSLLYFFTAGRIIDDKELSQTIDANIEAKFGDKTFDLTESVVNRFVQKYPFSDGQTRLKQIIDEADVLLPLNSNAPYFVKDADKTKQIIGFKQTDDRENKQFKDFLKDIPIQSDMLVPIQTKNEIFIIKEFGGFPLRIVNGLRELREQYERQKRLYDGYNLHNDSQVFFLDIIPPDGREMELLQDDFYTCLAFGKIQKNLDNNNYYLELEDTFRDEIYDVEISGIWEESLETISQNETIRKHLADTVTTMEEEVRENPDLFQEVYYPNLIKFVDELDELTEYDINYSQKKLVLGERPDRTSLGKDGILKRIYDKFIKIVNDAQEGNNVKKKRSLSARKKAQEQKLLTSGKTENNGKNYQTNKGKNTDILEADVIYENESDLWHDDSNIITEKIDKEFLKRWEGVTMKDLIDLRKVGDLSDDEFEKAKKIIGGL
ncbi:tubulin-like doman-containing protein [Cyanobacterium aponinum AL20118]|uniref:Tubulin-like doman-containing protein n=1 Tax=Cyanobacterium aponinum AL20115 TaxID=3090662 RepID=A0AAF1C548_9CHRO|nr:tubulin-like doman-containing protein [Cyanobacterium aponinum]WPF88135.1 tubulin-like doman-containing protein [Cyanobacterium aponinum AL20115]